MKQLFKTFVLLLLICMIPVGTAEAAVKLNATSKELKVGQVITLKVSGTKKKVKWSSTNKKVATVTQKGKVKAKQVGVTTIKAKIIGKTFRCKIEVKQDTDDSINSNTTQKLESETKEDLNGKIEILKEYTLSDSIGWYTRHFMVIKNNSNTTVDISTSSVAYSKDNLMVSAADSSFNALGAGCTSVFYEAFETSENIDHYETNMNVTESKYYDSVIQDLSYTQSSIENGVIFQVKNDGEKPAEFVEGYALFFLGDDLVEYESTYFTDNDYEIKSGQTITEQITTYEKFDRVEFYLTGRKKK